jgi:hypothetical protein
MARRSRMRRERISIGSPTLSGVTSGPEFCNKTCGFFDIINPRSGEKGPGFVKVDVDSSVPGPLEAEPINSLIRQNRTGCRPRTAPGRYPDVTRWNGLVALVEQWPMNPRSRGPAPWTEGAIV